MFFSGGAGFLRSNSTLVSLALLFQHLLLHRKEYVLVVTSAGVLHSYSFPKPLAQLAYVFGVLLSDTFCDAKHQTWKMELVVAGLLDLDPYCLYRFGSCSGQERKKTFDLLHPHKPSVSLHLLRPGLCLTCLVPDTYFLFSSPL